MNVFTATKHSIAVTPCQVWCAFGQRVMLDRDIAAFYGVETKRLNEKVLPHFRFLQSGLDERHLAAVLLGNDNILVHGPLLSLQSHPVATTLGRFHLIFWNLGRIAVHLHRDSENKV